MSGCLIHPFLYTRILGCCYNEEMIVLGIDPGTATSGWGVIRKNCSGFEAVEWGLIETDKRNDMASRYVDIYKGLSKIIKTHKPAVMAIEKVFFATNRKTAIRVGQAQGVMLYCAARARLEIAEYAPGTIKKLVSGSGRADKKQVQQAVRVYFGARVRSEKHKKTHFDNAADALAVALCHTKVVSM